MAQALGALGQQGEDAAIYPAVGTAVGVGQVSGGAGAAAYDLPTGIFLNKSMPAAIKLFFAATKRKQTPKDVATALREGGFESTSKNFEKIVATTMHRMKGDGDLLQFKDGWGLAELYPESLRLRITKDVKEAKPAKGGKRVRRSPQRKGSTAKAKARRTPHGGPRAVAPIASVA